MNTRKWLTGFIAVTTLLFTLTLLLFSQGEATLAQETDQPTALPDHYLSWEIDKAFSVTSAYGVLANDLNAEANGILATVVETTTHGTLVFAEDGAFSYTPDTGFSGKDTFTYKISNGDTDYNTAAVSIVVYQVVSDDVELLTVFKNDRAPVEPVFEWSYRETEAPYFMRGDYFNVKLTKDGIVVADEWIPSSVCFGQLCQSGLYDSETGTSIELYENGTYEWTVQAWTWTNNAKTEGELSEISATGYFNVNLDKAALPVFNVIEDRQGLLTLSVNNDPGTAWLNFYVISEDGDVLDSGWYQKGEDRILNAFPSNGKYTVYVQAWGPGGYSTGGVGGSGFASKTITRNEPAPVALAGVTVTNVNGGRPIFQFKPVDNAPWYNIQLFVDDVIIADEWYEVDLDPYDLVTNCYYVDPVYAPQFVSTPCLFAPDVVLDDNAEVTWKIGPWGAGVTDAIPYIEGSFTVNATTPPAPVLLVSWASQGYTFYEWRPVEASWYHVVLSQGGNNVLDEWYPAEDLYCTITDDIGRYNPTLIVSELGNCLLKSSTGGSFKVQAYGPAGLGDFSDQ